MVSNSPPYRRKINNPKHLSIQQQRVLYAYWVDEPASETAKRFGVGVKYIYAVRGRAKLRLMAPSMLAAAKKAVRLGLIQRYGSGL